MKEFYTIGEVAKIYNVSTDTLRFYDKIGLLSPWHKGDNGYRYYSKAQFEIISTIMLLRNMGTPVKNLRDALYSSSHDKIDAELERYSRSVDEEIARLQSLKREAEILRENIKFLPKGATESEVTNPEITTLPDMWMFSKQFGSEDELDIEQILYVNQLAKRDWTTRAGIISTITRDNLINHNFHTYDRYGYLSETAVEVDSPFLEKIPSRLCGVCSVRVCSLEHYEMDRAYLSLLDYIEEKGYRIAGEAIERNVLSIYGEDSRNPVMYFKIYIPVKKMSEK